MPRHIVLLKYVSRPFIFRWDLVSCLDQYNSISAVSLLAFKTEKLKALSPTLHPLKSVKVNKYPTICTFHHSHQFLSGNTAHWGLAERSGVVSPLALSYRDERAPQAVSGSYHKCSPVLQRTWRSRAGTCLHTVLITQKWHIFDGIRNCSTKRRDWFSKTLFHGDKNQPTIWPHLLHLLMITV